MARFGLFDSQGTKPAQEYEGDYMKQNGEYVMIFKYEVPGQKDSVHKQVAAIRLAASQSIKEIK